MTRALPVDLVARRSELRVAEDELVAGRGVLLTGPEGTGRTAFAAAVAASIERGGAAPLWIVATRSLSLVPFGALGWLLGDGAASSDVAATIGRLTTALGRHGGGALTVLVVDDVHLLDEPSAEVVLQALNCGAVAVLATAVDGAPLPTTVKRLVDASVLQAVALRPLARDDVETVAAEMVGGPIALTTAELLWRWSAGLPGLLKEIVGAGQDAGRFVPIAGRWWWVGPALVPSELAGRIDRLLAGADPRAEAAFDVVALAEPIELDEAASLVGHEALTELERRGLITTHRRGHADLVHCRTALVGAQRLATMTALRRRRAARRLLATARPPSSLVDVVRRATWHLDGDVRASEELLLAACAAVRLSDPPLARRLAGANRRWNDGVPAMVGSVDTHIESMEPAEARDVLDRARRTARSETDVRRVEMAEIAVCLFAERRPAAARSAIAEARLRRGARRDDPELRSLDGLVALLEARPDTAVEHASDVLAHPDASVTATMRATLIRSVADLLGGQTSSAITSAERLLDTTSRHAEAMVSAAGMARAVNAFARLWRGGPPPIPHAHPATARHPAPPCAPIGAGPPDDPPFEWPLMAGVVAHLRGDHDAAVARLRDAVVQQQDGKGIFHPEAVAWLVVALCDAGAPGDAAAALAQFPRRHLAVIPGLENWARGMLACSRRDVQRGSVLLRAAATDAARVGADLIEARYLIALADRCGNEAPIDRLDELARSLDAPVLQCLCRVAVAGVDRDVDGLLDGAEQLSGVGLDGRAIAVAALAGRIARDTEDSSSSKRATSVVRRLRRGGQAEPSDVKGGLSRRQAEVARLAAGGLSDREIAARLIVSIRTVESHLASAYRALGIASRSALAEALVV